MFSFFKPNPDDDSRNAFQQETYAEGDITREAQRICEILARPRQYNSPSSEGLRAVWHGREAEYLYGRFAAAFQWNSVADAERFYRRNR